MRATTKLRSVVTSRMLPSLLALGLALLPAVSFACPVCFAAEQRQLWAYFATAALLSLLPFVLFGGFVLWIRTERKRQARSSAHDQRPEQAAPTAEPALVLERS